MGKETFQNIVDLLRNELGGPIINHRGLPITPELQVAIAVRYLAKGAYQEDMGKIFQPFLNFHFILILQ